MIKVPFPKRVARQKRALARRMIEAERWIAQSKTAKTKDEIALVERKLKAAKTDIERLSAKLKGIGAIQ